MSDRKLSIAGINRAANNRLTNQNFLLSAKIPPVVGHDVQAIFYCKSFYGKDEENSTLSKSSFFGDVLEQFVLSDQDGVFIRHMSFQQNKLFAALHQF